VGLVGLDGNKMSKSLGNLVFVGDLLKEWEPAVIRLALLSHHYRPDWQWSRDDLVLAAARLEAWRAIGGMPPSGDPTDPGDTLGSDEDGLWRVRAALDDDLDTPTALAALDDEASLGRPVVQGAALLGVTL
jgi:L-cysteine:1D-myo-inositol 2-amino-2-deoxy-alpha-D-glucopyranoside ligase